jgi:hypothetical protein
MAPFGPSALVAREFIKPAKRLAPVERLEIYRRSYWARVLDSLADDFPGLRSVLGRRAFDRLSKAYLSDLPSCSFTMRNLGSRLHSWLRDHPGFGGDNLALALDMVRLEWEHIEAFDAGTKKPLGPEDLLELGPEMRFELQPHLRLLELQYPVDELRIRAQKFKAAVRRGSRQGGAPEAEVIALAVHRNEFIVFYRRLAVDELRVLSALGQGMPIGKAIALMEQSPDVIEGWFTSWSQLGWLCRPNGNQTKS